MNGKATLLTSGYVTGSYDVQVKWFADRVHDTLKVGGFVSNNGGFAPMKIYGLKIYETENEVETLVHDFKPAAGGRMIDAVTGRILDTKNAASPFADSPDLVEDPYVESAGNQYILLDYKPNAKSVIEVDYANVSTDKSRYVFGSDGTAFLWVNGNGNQEYYCHKAWSGGYPAGVDGRRHTTVIDIPGSKIYYKDSIYGVIRSLRHLCASGVERYALPVPGMRKVRRHRSSTRARRRSGRCMRRVRLSMFGRRTAR